MPGPYDRIFADIRKDLPSVVDAVLRQEMFRVLDDFTQMTNIWQEHVPIQIVPHTVTYNFTTTNGKPHRLMSVYSDQGSAQIMPPIWPPASRYEYTPNPNMWPGGVVSMRIPGRLHLSRDVDTNAVWWAVVAKRTAEPLSEDKYPVIDDWIVDRYADTIGRGILARLMLEPQKPYSNPMLATVNQRAYISGRSLARVNDGAHNVLNGASWRFPGGWGTVQKKGFT